MSGSNLKDLRKQAGVTQAELAARSGLRQATISALENGLVRPRAATVQALAVALGRDTEAVRAAIVRSRRLDDGAGGLDAIGQMERDWPFLGGLDPDLRVGLARKLVAEWTHSSTAIEGNTISAGDTLFVLTEGLTVSGKSLREHLELHGHAQAIALMAAWTQAHRPMRIEPLHELHRAVQTGVVVDALAPVGRWKVENNGTLAITTSGSSQWHEYAEARHVPALVDAWIESTAQFCRSPLLKPSKGPESPKTCEFLLDAYTDTHLGFVAIHPYADGNGRMARLLANIPVLRAGFPPLLVNAARRREYLTLLGDYSLRRGQPGPGENLVAPGPERNALRSFFAGQWQRTLRIVAEFHERQKGRTGIRDPVEADD